MMIETLGHDCSGAWRHLRRSPTFAAVAVFTLAAAIGANTAMFSILNALTLKRVAISEPDGLMAIMPLSSRGQPRSTPVPAVTELEKQGPLVDVCGYLGGVVLPVMANRQPVQTLTTFVTGKCFDAFRIRPVLGRVITDSDAPIFSAGRHVAVISHRLWERAFQSDRSAIGQHMMVNNVAVEIIGVLPPGFVGLEVDHGVDVFTPFDAVLRASPSRRQLAGMILGRLKTDRTVSAAESEIKALWPAILDVAVPSTLSPAERTSLHDSIPRLLPMGRGVSPNRQRYTRPLLLTVGMTFVLLLVACVNLAGLLLSRMAVRDQEVQIRQALGGTMSRIVRQVTFESLLLSGAGAVLSVPVAYGAAWALTSMMPPVNVPYSMSFAPDPRVLAITAGLAVIVGIAVSLYPALQLRRKQSLTGHQHSVVGGGGRMARTLIAVQVALSTAVLIAAILLSRSLLALTESDHGVDEKGVLSIKLLPLPDVPEKRAERAVYYPWLIERITEIPRVQSAALALNFPRMTLPPGVSVSLVENPDAVVLSGADRVSPAFFETMRIRVLDGRTFTDADTLQAPPVAIVSESLARALLPGGGIIGRRIKAGNTAADQAVTIVGVVGNATQGDPRDATRPLVYRPALQLGVEAAFQPNVLIRTDDVASAATAVKKLVDEAGREYIQEVIAVDRVLARAPASERMSAAVSLIVAGLAALLAAIGIYSTLAYSISQRSREIGLRLAVGASPTNVATSIIGRALVPVMIGVVAGCPGGFWVGRSLRSLLFGISEADVATYAGVAIAFLAIGLAAASIPAIRASRLDPVRTLAPE